MAPAFCVSRGAALFSNGYSNGVIGAVITLLTREHPGGQFGTQFHSKLLASMVYPGTVFGMLLCGWLLSTVGMSMVVLPVIVILCSVLTAVMAIWNGESVGGLVAGVSFLRCMLGIGVGAGQSSGCVFPSEWTERDGVVKNVRHRWLVLGTKTMIDAGFVLAAFVPLVLYWRFGEQHLHTIYSLSLGLGAIPASVLVFEFIVWCWWITPKYDNYSLPKAVHIPIWLTLKWYWKSVLGLSLAWFMYDFIMYPFGIYSSMVVNNITGGHSSLSIVLGWSVVINLFCIPGTVFGIFLIDCLGVKATMIIGLLLQAIVGFAMAIMHSQLTNHIATYAVVYGIFLSLGEVGPGSCLRVLAAKTAPVVRVGGQVYNIAAMIGQVGAFIGTWVLPQIIDAFGGSQTMKGNTGPFWIGGGLAILNAVVTFFLVEPLTHDNMKAEEKAFCQYLEVHGVDASHIHDGI
ncbi:major facilitator superfamily domain-containing protein [Pisolithus tinctorius]|uniref:Major facilitator superfamily (MFS) profile domain-containing protein n=1 Tax=Pisolithus tinctorius Marx 270 TaxID=870435 RepID=A0A0C3PYH1_PISTI|nr:major facilitator superfamily domain-containing protein [Pisolithus tinctorius]KIO14701.1 hypothetical protein M404DRAFT_182099 [Pisolithus tinctorius Marx 270]